jgi:fibronectin type 3 domain-containing protein
MYSFGYAIIFVMQMMFSVNVVNMKVVSNLLILIVLKFDEHRPNSLEVMLPASSLLDFAYALYRSK